jgi:Flagellar FliJ protein
MDNRARKSLLAAERVRQIVVDDAKRSLSDAIYLRTALRGTVARLSAEAAAVEARELAILRVPGGLDLGHLNLARQYRRWIRGELDSATKALDSAERAEADARTALGAAVRDRDAVRRLQTRRCIEEHEWTARRDQRASDDHGAMRATAPGSPLVFCSGGRDGN